MSRDMLEMVDVLAREKEVDKSAVFAVLEMALASAVKKARFPGEDADVVVSVNTETGDWTAKRRWLIVDDAAGLQQPDREEMFSDITDEYPTLKVGDYIEKPVENINTSGRRFAQDAKQVILQRLRDAEREQVLKEFLERGEKIVSGQIKRVDKEGAIVEVGRLEARLPRSEMIPRENLRSTERVRAYVLRIDETPKGKTVILSRSCPEFLIKLFELEVPEIEEGVVEIKSAARDPGVRAKVSVMSHDKRVEPVGTCIGIRGSRVTAVTNELAGERIDVVRYDDNPVQYIVEALKPAKVSTVVADEESNSMDVMVDEDNLAIAIGTHGQNVRLATELTGWQINIMTAEEADKKHAQEIAEAKEEFMTALDMDEEAAVALIDSGIYSLEELAYVPEQEIIDLGLFDKETVAELRDRARSALLSRALKREENLRQADATLLAVPGMDHDLAATLVSKGVKTGDDLGDLASDELVEMTGIPEERANALIMAARASWTDGK